MNLIVRVVASTRNEERTRVSVKIETTILKNALSTDSTEDATTAKTLAKTKTSATTTEMKNASTEGATTTDTIAHMKKKKSPKDRGEMRKETIAMNERRDITMKMMLRNK